MRSPRYLAATAVLGAGLDAIDNKLDSGEPNSDNLYEASEEEIRSSGVEMLPANLLEAVSELEKDEALRESLGTATSTEGLRQHYVDYFAAVKRGEWRRYHEQVTPWELREYLTRF